MTVADVVDLALMCYRVPLAHQDQLAASAPLPEGMDRLLALASGSQDALEVAARRAAARPDEVRDAARFLVQQLCCVRGAGYYRVLGLEPDASFDRIKEHHRRLMQLYHPDRDAGCETWTDGYAARINEAWAVLSRPESRASYDAQLPRLEPQPETQPEFRWASPSVGTRSPPRHRGVLGGAGARQVERRPWPRRALRLRRLPMLVLGGCALVAALVVLAIHLIPAPSALVSTPVAISVTQPALPPNLAAREAALERVQAQRQQIEQRLKAEQHRVAELARVQQTPATPMPPVEPVLQWPAEPPRARTDSELTSPSLLPRGAARSPVGRVGGPPPAEPEPVALGTSLRLAQRAVAPTGVAPIARLSAAPVIASTPDQPGLTDRDLAALVDRYTGAYRSGDLDGLMTLFAPDVRGQAGNDRAGIRRVFGAQFAAFLVLRLELHDLRWARHGSTASAVARYELWLRGRRNNQLSQSAGTIRLNLRKHESQVLIEAIDYDWQSK